MISFKQFPFNYLVAASAAILLSACGGGGGSDSSSNSDGGFTTTNTKPTISSEASTGTPTNSAASVNSLAASSAIETPPTQGAQSSLASSSNSSKSSAKSSASSSKAASSASSSKLASRLDTTPPAQPDNFTTQSVRQDIVILKWNDATDNVGVAYYNLYRDGVLLDTLDSTENVYYDYDVASSRSYTYTITAGDIAGNWSTLSLKEVKTPSLAIPTGPAPTTSSSSSTASVSSTGPTNPTSSATSVSSTATTSSSVRSSSASSKAYVDTVIPTAPNDLLKLRASNVQVDISWTAATDNIGVAGYKIYRDGTLLKTVSADVFTYSDKTVAPDSSYWFGVSAGDAAGNWSTQKLLNIKTPPATSSGTVTLQWERPTQRENGNTLLASDLAGYDVRYKSPQEPGYHYLTAGKTDTQIIINNLSGENTFEISAFDTNGRRSYFATLEPK